MKYLVAFYVVVLAIMSLAALSINTTMGEISIMPSGGMIRRTGSSTGSVSPRISWTIGLVGETFGTGPPTGKTASLVPWHWLSDVA